MITYFTFLTLEHVCITEQAEVNRLKSQFPVLGSVSGRNNRVENMATAIEELILSTESLRQAIALKSQQNADHEDQVKMVSGILSQVIFTGSRALFCG